jgi:RNA polymerase sigma-70 factor (ECF subfamily)
MTSPDSPDERHDTSALWDRFHGELFGFVRGRLDSEAAAEDVLQSAFLRAHRALESGSPPEEPRAWLFQITRNLIKDTYRYRGRQNALSEALQSVAPEETETVGPATQETEHDSRAAAEVVARALPHFVASLQSPYRETLELTELQGLTQAQAAEALGVSLAAVKSRVLRGREQLKQALHRCCAFEIDRRGKVVECSPRGPSAECNSCG